jgi:hypothetical protein
MEINELKLPDGRYVDLIIQYQSGYPGTYWDPPEPSEIEVEEGWLVDEDGDVLRKLNKKELDEISDNDQLYLAVQEKADELFYKEEERAERQMDEEAAKAEDFKLPEDDVW